MKINKAEHQNLGFPISYYETEVLTDEMVNYRIAVIYLAIKFLFPKMLPLVPSMPPEAVGQITLSRPFQTRINSDFLDVKKSERNNGSEVANVGIKIVGDINLCEGEEIEFQIDGENYKVNVDKTLIDYILKTSRGGSSANLAEAIVKMLLLWHLAGKPTGGNGFPIGRRPPRIVRPNMQPGRDPIDLGNYNAAPSSRLFGRRNQSNPQDRNRPKNQCPKPKKGKVQVDESYQSDPALKTFTRKAKRNPLAVKNLQDIKKKLRQGESPMKIGKEPTNLGNGFYYIRKPVARAIVKIDPQTGNADIVAFTFRSPTTSMGKFARLVNSHFDTKLDINPNAY